MHYTVTVTDSADRVVFTKNVEVHLDPKNPVIGGEGEPLTEVQDALLQVAPEVCPWDCDHCRGD